MGGRASSAPPRARRMRSAWATPRTLPRLEAVPGRDRLARVRIVVVDDHADTREIVARFDPKLVKMCGDGSKAED